jgi:spermidine synthase
LKITIWKKILSYFFDIQLEKKKSSFSGDLQILLSRGRIALCTKNAMYSFDDLYLNFKTAFSKLNISKINTDKVLLLGTGLLSVPYLLEKNHQKKINCKAVDIDPMVLEAAVQYSLPKLVSKIELICADAAAFVLSDNEKYNLIVVDIFIDDTVPSTFEQEDFLKRLKNLLSENGLLMYNRMFNNKVSSERTESFYNQTFKQIFSKSEMLRLKGNCMLLGNYSSKN